jgi:predicted RNA-binding Zn-ribbon protein involved in translation (DUF1610 family)
MTDLERLFRRLVDNLIAIDPARLHHPVALGDLFESVIPYRTNRRSLAIDSAEDYDMLLLRLCAGEGGYVRLVNHEVAQRFRDQAGSPNPDLSILRNHSQAELLLETEPLAHALGPSPDELFAPPEDGPPAAAASLSPSPSPDAPPAGTEFPLDRRRNSPPLDSSFTPMVPPPPRITPEPEPESRPARGTEGGNRCSFCGGRLPLGRAVNFCPHCGQNQSLIRCPECQTELELGWKHCINCGHLVGE